MEDYKKKGILIIGAGFVLFVFMIWLFFFSPISIFS